MKSDVQISGSQMTANPHSSTLALALLCACSFTAACLFHFSVQPDFSIELFSVHLAPPSPITILLFQIAIICAAILYVIPREKDAKSALRKCAVLLTIVLASFVIAFVTCGFFHQERAANLNVAIIDIDTLRADFVSAYGENNAYTPNIDSLAENGWLFYNAFSHVPITLPSHCTIFTGQLPHQLNVLNNSGEYKQSAPLLAEIFKNSGYKTGAFVSLGVLQSGSGLNRGFIHYDERMPQNGQWFVSAEKITKRAIAWMSDNIGDHDRFFIWLHYSDPHEPYISPDAPPDTGIEFDGTELTVGNLDSRAYIESTLTLSPGRHEIVIKRLARGGATQFIDEMHFLMADGSPLPADWFTSKIDLANNAREIDTLTLQNSLFMKKIDNIQIGPLLISEAKGWRKVWNRAGHSAKTISQNAEIAIDNTSNSDVSLMLRIKGGLIKSARNGIEDYSEEVEYCDRHIGAFLRYLKSRRMLDNTLIVVLADHGEELNEHGFFGHIHELFTQSLHVPLIIRHPSGHPAHAKVIEPVGLMDVAPTILALTGHDVPTGSAGINLAHLVAGNTIDRPIFAETFAPEATSNKYALISREHLVIYTPDFPAIKRIEQYDILNDPHQWQNVSLSNENQDSRELVSRLINYASAISPSNAAQESSAHTEQMLRDLGYINVSKKHHHRKRNSLPISSKLEKITSKLLTINVNGMRVESVAVKTMKQSDSDDPLEYVSVEIQVPEDTNIYCIMTIQDTVIAEALPIVRPLPVRLSIRSQNEIIMDRMLNEH
jgi:hypothetical protein